MAHRAIIKETEFIIAIVLLLTVIPLFTPANTIAQAHVDWGNSPFIGICYPVSSPFIYQNSTFDISVEYGQPVNRDQFDNFSYTLDGVSDCMLNYSKNYNDSYHWNYSISGILENVPNGNHSVVVNAHCINGSICEIWGTAFTVDTTFPTPVITVISPLNQTYHSDKIDIAYSVDSPTIMAYYSIDAPDSRPSNYTTFNGSRSLTVNNLPDGTYKISFWIHTEAGEHIYINPPYAPIETVYFTVDTAPPYLAIIIVAVVVATGLATLLFVVKHRKTALALR